MAEDAKFIEFTKSVFPSLLDIGFTPIEEYGFNEEESVISSPLYGFVKNEGGMLYYAVFYHVLENYNNLNSSYFMDKVNNITKNYNVRNTIVFNIYVTDEPNEQLIKIVNDSEEYVGQAVYAINYAVTLSTHIVGYSIKQPQNVLKMNERLTACLEKKEEKDNIDINNNIDNSSESSNMRMKTYIQPCVQNEWIIYVIMVINACVFGLMEFFGGSTDANTLIIFGALVPDYVRYGGEWYRLFTSMFVHIGLMHLLFNSLSLYIFGSRVEKHYGRIEFLIIYIISGVFGSVLTLFTDTQIAAGASGGIFGLIGATLAITQIYKRQIEGLSFYAIFILALFGVLQGLLMPNIGNAAHIGGMIGGYLSGLIICKIKIKKQLNC